MKAITKKTGIIILMLAMLLTLCTPLMTMQASAASKKSIKITCIKSGSTLPVGTSRSLSVKTSIKCKKITYSSSNSKIATIKSGRVYGYKVGTVKVKITATPKSSKYKTTSKYIYVKVLGLAKPSVSLSRNSKTIKMSSSYNKYATSYQFQYATNPKMSSTITKTTTSYKGTSFAGKSGKTYYVRVRAIRKAYNKTFYSSWSTVKYIKVPAAIVAPTPTPTPTPVPQPNPTPVEPSEPVTPTPEPTVPDMTIDVPSIVITDINPDSITDSSIRVSASQKHNSDVYRFQFATKPDMSDAITEDLLPSGKTFLNDKVATYYVRVKAGNYSAGKDGNLGYTAWSDIVKFSTKKIIPTYRTEYIPTLCMYPLEDYFRDKTPAYFLYNDNRPEVVEAIKAEYPDAELLYTPDINFYTPDYDGDNNGVSDNDAAAARYANVLNDKYTEILTPTMSQEDIEKYSYGRTNLRIYLGRCWSDFEVKFLVED